MRLFVTGTKAGSLLGALPDRGPHRVLRGRDSHEQSVVERSVTDGLKTTSNAGNCP